MDFAELEAFEEESRAVADTLTDAPADAWQRPALGEWSVTELVAHLVRGVTRVDAYLDVDIDDEYQAAGGREPVLLDRVGYWRFDLAGEAPAIAERARQEAEGTTPDVLVERFMQGWQTSAARAGGLPPGHLIATSRGLLRLDEYLATRVVELVVHHMDLRAALDLPPAATPRAERLTMHLLESLLGSPRPRNFGRDRFIRAATGRLTVEDPRFPVLR